MTPQQAVTFVTEHGVVLESSTGPVPSIAATIAGETIRGSWWGHPKSHEIFGATQAIRTSDDILVCRLVGGKITYVHRRLWPALVRLAKAFPRERLAWVHNIHTAAGHHINEEIAFPEWVPTQALKDAKRLSDAEALQVMGPWAAEPTRSARSTGRAPAARSRRPTRSKTTRSH